jgi:tetratricopeptide (TPR) repeat protein
LEIDKFQEKLYTLFQRYQQCNNLDSFSAKIPFLLYDNDTYEALNFFYEFGIKLYDNNYYNFSIIVFIIVQEFLRIKNKEHQIITKNKENQLISECHIYIGQADYNLRNYSNAIESYNESLKIKKKINDLDGEARIYGNLGIRYDDLKQYDKAIDYHNQSLDIAKMIGNKETEAKCYANLGVSYYHLHDFQKALEYHNKALEMAKMIGNKKIEAISYTNLGLVHNSLGD